MPRIPCKHYSGSRRHAHPCTRESTSMQALEPQTRATYNRQTTWSSRIHATTFARARTAQARTPGETAKRRNHTGHGHARTDHRHKHHGTENRAPPNQIDARRPCVCVEKKKTRVEQVSLCVCVVRHTIYHSAQPINTTAAYYQRASRHTTLHLRGWDSPPSDGDLTSHT